MRHRRFHSCEILRGLKFGMRSLDMGRCVAFVLFFWVHPFVGDSFTPIHVMAGSGMIPARIQLWRSLQRSNCPSFL